MAITTLDGYIGAYKQKEKYQRATMTSVAAQWHTLFNANGDPGAGSFGYNYGIANPSVNGFVCENGRPGFISLRPFNTGAIGYLTGFEFSNSVAGRFMVYDRIWESGPHLATTLTQRSITANASTYQYRVPKKINGLPDWGAISIWVDVSTQFSASATTLAFQYVDDTSSLKWTPATATLSGFITGRTFQMPLAAGSGGVIKITDVSVGGATNANGCFNVYLSRTLYINPRVNVANFSDVHGFDKTGMPIVDSSACIGINYAADSTATGVVDVIVDIANA